MYGEMYDNTNAVQPSDPQRANSCLAGVIERYESGPKAREGSLEEDDIDSLADRLIRIPKITDPDIYSVRVHVCLFLDVASIRY